MSDTPPPERTYQHQVPAEVFIEAFTTPIWTHAQTKKFNALGIERLRGSELRKRSENLDYWYFWNNDEFTLLIDVEIIGDIDINNYPRIAPNWCIYQSKLTNVLFNYCQWGRVDKETKRPTHGTNFYIVNSIMGNSQISNSMIRNFSIWNSKAENFHLIKSSMGYLNISNSSAENFNINDSFTENVNINDSKTGSLIIDKSNTNHFTIDTSILGNFRIENGTIRNVSIWSSKTGNFHLNESSSGYFSISNSTTENFHINNCTTGFLHIYNNSTTGSFDVENSTAPHWEMISLSSSFHFSKATIGQCRLIDCRIPELTIQNECSIELYVSEGKINHLNFEQLTLGKSSVVSLSNTLIYACNMNEFAMLGNLYLRGVKRANDVYVWPDIESTLHKKYTSDGIRKESNNYKWTKEILEDQYTKYIGNSKKLTEKFASATFRISQSSLGKTEFTECDLEKFNFEYNNSKITEVFISGGTLPRDVNVYGETDKLKILEQQKSFFDQLKKVFEGQGDIVRGTKYHALASEKQMEIIEAEKGMWSSEWWVYWLNKKSNKHGESWWQAVKFIFCVSVPIYIIYWLLTFQISLQGDWNWKLLGDFFGYYFSFLLPTHKVDFIPDVKQNVGTLFFDFFGRIAIGYGIYQLISAFRKHGKKA